MQYIISIDMPELSRFLGIVIYMYYKDHAPPHFHAKYAEYRASFRIDTLELIEGEIPSRVRSLILEWADMHRDELSDNWARQEQGKALTQIEPLVR